MMQHVYTAIIVQSYMSLQFRPHGQYTIRAEGRLVISEVTGPWNIELARACAHDLHALVLPMAAAGGTHVGMAIVHNSILCPPDALELMEKSVRYAYRHLGCIGNFVVAGAEVEGRALMAASFRKMYSGTGPFWYLDDAHLARAQAAALLEAAP